MDFHFRIVQQNGEQMLWNVSIWIKKNINLFNKCYQNIFWIHLNLDLLLNNLKLILYTKFKQTKIE